ncbi:MAG TPA: glycosyltransferase 87 family protein [Candidatus Baltobacteraceae bacterium]|nr:glycosyltransferase 87 family protein [Candidatus Baltobacteraceae bacterium]
MEAARVARLGLAGLAIALVAYLALDPAARPSGFLRDFNAFYCAGAALDRNADPYRAEPLGTCEREVRPAPFAFGRANLSVPAPLPPYALAPFAVLARLPYPVAAALWILALAAAFVVTTLALRRATGLPLPGIVAALALGDGYASLCIGQIAPLAVAAVALAALFAEQGRVAAAGWAAAAAMLEPHVGLPACVGLFVWRAGARIPLLASAAVALALSLWLAGPAVSLEYVQSVIPAHALSEIANEKQLSLSYFLHRLGLDETLALRAGSLSYLVMLALGVGLSPPLAQRLRSPGLLAALPPALALLGGPFGHIAQVPAALPATLLLLARAPQARRVLSAVTVMLAIPWVQFTTLGTLFGVLAALATGIIARTLGGARAMAAAALGFGALLFVGLLLALVLTQPPDPTALLAAHYDPRALAESSWGLYVTTVAGSNLAAYDLARVPTLAGLLVLALWSLRNGSSAAARIPPQ